MDGQDEADGRLAAHVDFQKSTKDMMFAIEDHMDTFVRFHSQQIWRRFRADTETSRNE